jgi:hypothetical protein
MPKENVMPEIPPIITHVLVQQCAQMQRPKPAEKKAEEESYTGKRAREKT